MQWYYFVNNQQFGPVDDAEITRLARSGVIKPADLVWNPSLGAKWLPAYSVEGLFVWPGGHPPLAAPSLAFAPTNAQTPNADLMAQARECLQGKWGISIGAVLILVAINMALNAVSYIRHAVVLTLPVGFLISPVLQLGACVLFLSVARKGTTSIELLFKGFERFGTALLAGLLTTVFVFLWLLLLIIPGIIAALSYSQTMYILADDPQIGALDAIRASKEMMRGKKWKFFCLGCRFIGWALLCLLTCGIGFIFLAPYAQTSVARFYDDAKAPAADHAPAVPVEPSSQPLPVAPA
jgi:uncharacterized membrane protein